MNHHRTVTDTLSPDKIKEELRTSCMGREVIYFASTPSTNLQAKRSAQAGLAEGTLVITDNQTHGRGRFERTWWSSPGKDVLFSLIFRPLLGVSQAFRLTLLSSLAVAEGIRQETGLEALIKWPNDVYVRGKKVSGILSESGVRNDHLEYVIVGIGINVNSTFAGHPEIKDCATSLCRELGRTVSRLRMLTAVVTLIESYYQSLQKGGFHALKKKWDTLSLIARRKIMVKSGECTHEGIADSIDEDGFLILLDRNGTKKRIVSGDVSLLLL